jgi:alpha-ketoglutarate-dependent 2,4-dichlorophenoxyacetate dioxygenase
MANYGATKYKVCVFRSASVDNRVHINLAERFGELDDIKPYLAFSNRNRLAYAKLFNVGNLDANVGLAIPLQSRRQLMVLRIGRERKWSQGKY